MIRAALTLCLLASPALADMQVENFRYLCDRGVEVPVVYATELVPDGTSIVVLSVEGGQYLLYAEPAATPVRFSWPSDGASYVWTIQGDTGRLSWREAGQETVLLATCTRM